MNRRKRIDAYLKSLKHAQNPQSNEEKNERRDLNWGIDTKSRSILSSSRCTLPEKETPKTKPTLERARERETRRKEGRKI